MVELQNNGVFFPAVYAGMLVKILQNVLSIIVEIISSALVYPLNV
jgi:hypothetical protein